jgi:hypothetical protein
MSEPAVPPPTRPAADQESGEPVKRKMLMGVALLLAMGSIYAGLLDAGRLAQVTLATGATIAVDVRVRGANARA